MGESINSPDEVVQVVDEPRMLEQSAFGSSCGAAGEDDVGQAIGVAPTFCWPLLWIDGHLVPVSIQVHPLRGWRQGNDGVDAREAQQHRHLSSMLLKDLSWVTTLGIKELAESMVILQNAICRQ